MTVSSQNSKDGPYNCNGSQDTFPFTFKVFTKNDLVVVLTDTTSDVETDLNVDSDFSVSLNADQNASPGGSITTLTVYPAGQKITIVRDVAATQQTAITNFRPAVIERALDKLTMLVQQTVEGLSRAVKVKVSSSGASPDDLIASIEASVNQAETFAQEAAESSGTAVTSANTSQVAAANAFASAVNAANSAASVDITAEALQQQTKTAFSTAGFSPTFTVTSFPLYGAYATNERMRIKFNGNVAAAACTLNRDTLGAKSIKQYDSTGAKVNPVIFANVPYDLEYDGTDYVILNPSVPAYNSVLNLTGGQIKFPATQAPSSDANTLDDYEEGTWTPDVQGVTGTIQSVSGNYVKVGRMITYSALITGVTTVAFTNGTSYINNFPTNATPSIPCQFAVGGGSGAGNYTSRGLFIVNPAIDGGWLPTSAAAKYHIVTGTYISNS